MGEHPIQKMMETAMKSLKDMVDVDTVVGEAIQAPNGTIIIPISQVGFGFGAGGSNFGGQATNDPKGTSTEAMFGGGSGGGVSINPLGFLVVSGDTIKLLPVTTKPTPADKIIDLVPEMFAKVNNFIKDKRKDKDDDVSEVTQTVTVTDTDEE